MANFNYITAQGVIVPDTATIKQEVEQEWRDAFGQDLVVTPETPQGVLITAEVETRDAVARNNATLANQINPDIAGGVFLDAIWALTRGARLGATRSIITGAVLSGVSGTIVPVGSLAAVQGSGEQFRTTGAVVIGAGGTALANLESVNTGPIAAGINQLVQVATAVLGWEAVTNPSAAVLGRIGESDIASRRRRRQTLALQGVSISEAITSRLHAVPGVRSLAFRENVSNLTQIIDGVSLGPHSIYVCIDGGADASVAAALLASKSMGAGWNGAILFLVTDQFSGQQYTVKWDRPTVIPIFVRVTAKYNNTDAQVIIPDAIVAYANGELEGDAGLTVGADVSSFEFAGAINQVEPRIFVHKVELSLNGTTWQTDDLVFTIQQKASVSVSSVQVIAA